MCVSEVVVVLAQWMDWRVIFVLVGTVAPLVPHWKYHVSLAPLAALLGLPDVCPAQLEPCVPPQPLRSPPHALKVCSACSTGQKFAECIFAVGCAFCLVDCYTEFFVIQ